MRKGYMKSFLYLLGATICWLLLAATMGGMVAIIAKAI